MKKWVAAAAALFFFPSPCRGDGGPAVSVLFSSSLEPYQQAYEGFRQTLKDGRPSARLVSHHLDSGSPTEIAARMAAERPRLILAIGTPALKFAKENAKKVPVVFCMVLNAEAYVGENVAGVSMNIPPAMKLGAIRKVLPHAKRLGVIYSSDSAAMREGIIRGAAQAGFSVRDKKIATNKELPEALNDLAWRVDVFLMIPDSSVYFPKSAEYLLQESLKQKFPVVGLSSIYTKAGALLSLDCDYADLGRQAAELALRILQGKKTGGPGSIPPRKANLSLNLTTAERLGLSIPKEAVQEAAQTWNQ